MSFSVYTGGSVSNDVVYAASSVIDNSWGCTHTNYQTQVTITSPTGRVAASGVQSGLQASTSLAVNGDLGDYSIVVTGSYYCGCSFLTLGFGGSEVIQVPACAWPKNFRWEKDPDINNERGELRFYYEWDSNTGVLDDLSACNIGEKVTYPGEGDFIYPAPFPYVQVPNPTVNDGPAWGGKGQDTHDFGGLGGEAFRKPYFYNTVNATQIYRYSCPCVEGGEWQTIHGPLNIHRRVDERTSFPGWKFLLIKSGKKAKINPLP